MSLNYTLPAEFKEFATTSVMDEFYQLGNNYLRWRLWLCATSSTKREWSTILEHLYFDGIDVESWLAAVASYSESLRGNLDWINDIPRGEDC
jgi:hypothetical protein